MSTRTVVVGGGIMGAGIAYEARVAGFPVTIVESKPEFLEAAESRVAHYESRARSKGAELAGFGSLDLTTDLPVAAAEADVIVEAVSEDLDLKRSIFTTIGLAARDDTVLASNTSGLPIEVLGAASGRPGQVVGTHFFNPVPAMRLVEVVRSVETSDATVARALEFCRALGKETVEIRDLPGFVTTRLGTLLMCEGIRAYEQGVASAEHLDTAMKLGYNHPMGPLELADRVGLDTLLAILDDMREAFGDAFRAPPLLRQMVAAGKLGRKSGRGFYDYS
ncbi:MAG TPA: 3-hydroxyacyl-CoA dehydrogenase family protein [Acidimicrobiia bacterium]|jgi:3-hydroxybutyryl-CoA dehydrogenase